MAEREWLAERFQAHRSHLQGVAYRMLGSLSEAEDAVQEAWLRLTRADPGSIDNLGAWLTTVVARVCLDLLRSRKSRREDSLGRQIPELSAGSGQTTDPEREAILADSVGIALLAVLDTLAPAERLAFVLHDIFAVPFDEIAPIVERTPGTTKKLASRARQRLQRKIAMPSADLDRHRRVVDAFLAAARTGDMGALLTVLDPDVIRRADRAAIPVGAALELHGAREVAAETVTNAQRARFAQTALVNGAVGIVVAPHGRLTVALRLKIENERIKEIDVVADPAQLSKLDLALLER